MITNFMIASNPFFESYLKSDGLGKLIFIGLIVLSICSWIILLHKLWLTYQAKKNSAQFQQIFLMNKISPLNIDCELKNQNVLNPFFSIYLNLKKNTIDLLNKNRYHLFKKSAAQEECAYLSPSDIDFVEGHLASTITDQTKHLEKNLFILATIVSLGPFLGLLGTVWGILMTFSEMTGASGGNSHQAILGGLSLALATTVLGLIDAIPALIGYNYLKNTIREFETDMEKFAQEALSSIEMQYRKVDIE